jgi:hypothetical protein
MNPPITFEEITTSSTRNDGSVTFQLDNAKAAKAFLTKMTLVVETFDSREEKPEIWYHENGSWHPGGAFLITYFMDQIGGNYSSAESINDVLRRIRGVLRLKPVEFDVTNPYLIGTKEV